MISTTHVDLRLRAEDRDIDTRVVHAPTAESAASSLTGLQNYRFGKATTLPFEWAHGADGVPGSVVDTIEANLERGSTRSATWTSRSTTRESRATST